MKKLLLSFACLYLTLMAPSGLAKKLEIPEQIEKLDREIEALSLMRTHIASVPERDREALLFRSDQRAFQVLKILDQVTRRMADLAEDEPVRVDFTARLESDLRDVSTGIMERMGELDQRIAEHRTEAKEASGGAQIGLKAYVLTLESQRFRYNEALVDLVESREALGLDASIARKYLADDLYVTAEVQVGKLGFARGAQKEIEARLKMDSSNTDLQAALNLANIDHAQFHSELRETKDLLERLGLDTSEYEAILLQHGSGVSVEVFKPNVMLQLLEDGWSSLQEAAIKHAPNIIFNIFLFLLVILVFRLLSRWTQRLVQALLDRSNADMSSLMKNILVSVSGGTVMALGFLMALSQAGISIGPALAGLGVAGFVVGFALQDTLGNFAAGAMILFYRPYDVDDFVEVAGASGLVKEMSMVSTTIATFDNQTLVVPNSKIWGDVIKNVTAQKVRRVDLEFGIGYSDDIEKAEAVLADIVESHERVLKRPECRIKLHTLGDSSVNFVVRPWVRTADYWDVYWDLTREVKMRFDREGISIPFPQRDVHLYREDPT